MHTLDLHAALIRPLLSNLALGWLWIVLGFACGGLMGLRFHAENWLGGYGSFPRRLYRLGHIAFFGLGFINLLFVFTAWVVGGEGNGWMVSARAFLIGAITMPPCCLLMAHRPQWRPPVLFAVPVASLLIAGVSLLWQLLHI
jgi:hypothetical protein